MPNIISQEISSSGISITSNAGTFSITFIAILERYVSESGSPAARRSAVIAWLRQQIETVLGSSLVKGNNIDFDFTPGSGRVNRLKING